MKLVRFGPPGLEKPGVLDAEGRVRDLSEVIPDIGGLTLQPDALERLRALDPASLPLAPEGARLGPCVIGTGKMMCIGLNYRDHATETGQELPKEPLLFMKATSAINGPFDDVVIPRGAEAMDHEAELGVVIGRTAKYVGEADALDHVAGYCIVNDVSERVFQRQRGGQMTKGKSCDTFAPLGPWLVTPDEVPDPQALPIRLDVDGDLRQDGTTADMVFTVAHVISYLSHFFTLRTGDVIATGTPAGVAGAMTPPQFLKPGQTVTIRIDGLGAQRSRFVADV